MSDKTDTTSLEADFSEEHPEMTATMTVSDRINYHYRAAERNWEKAQKHALLCGWELARQKTVVGWGGWKKWVKENLDFSKDSADRLIGFYEAKIGAERKRIGVAIENEITPEEFVAACAGSEGKSVTAAMIESGVLKSHSDNWGGDRREAAAANGNTVGRPKLIPDNGVTEGIRKAAVKKWGEVQREVGYFLGHQFELALTLPEVREALKTAMALTDALAHRKAELDNGGRK